MSNDLTPWDLAMDAIEDCGCDCDGDPEDIADHTCIAARCEHALLIERAERDEARRERDAALAEVERLTAAVADNHKAIDYYGDVAERAEAESSNTRDELLRMTAERDEARKDRDALVARRIVTVCAEHGDELSSTWEDDDGDLLVTVEPCGRCTQDAFGAGHARATGRHL